MRCVLLVKRFWPSLGGVEKYVTELARGLVLGGHQVAVVTGRHAQNLPARDALDGISIRRFSALRSPWRCAAELSGMRSLFQRADVVHVSDTEMLECFWRTVGWQIVPRRLCLTIHGMSCVHPVPQRELVRARASHRRVDGVIHDGAFIGKWLGVQPDLIIPQGLRPTPKEIVQQPPPSSPSAIYVGRLEHDTGISLYLEAVRVLRECWNLIVPLHIYGEGSMRAALADYTKLHTLPVTFHSAAADAQEQIGAHTLAFVSGRMTVHEALARRRPVIAAFVNPIRADYVGGESFSPWIATGGSGTEIAAHAARLIADRDAWTATTQRGWQHVQALSWQRTAETYVEFWSTRTTSPTRPISWSQRIGLAWELWRARQRNPSRGHKRAGGSTAPEATGWPTPSGVPSR